MLALRVPDGDFIPDHAWREIPLYSWQVDRMRESYRSVRNRWLHGKCTGGHLWMRFENGPWACEHCPEERWTL